MGRASDGRGGRGCRSGVNEGAMVAVAAAMAAATFVWADNCPDHHPESCPLAQPAWAVPADATLFSNVCQNGATERAQDRCSAVPHTAGNFTCQCCGHTLFSAADKCHSGTGWPSFTRTLGACVKDTGEVVCAHCGAHLGDYFHSPGWTADATCFLDGDTSRPSRFCIDGVCLRPPPDTVYGDQCTVTPTCASGYGTAVYFGDGCFWHTQYDMYLVERSPPFNRSIEDVTARVGYAGGFGTGADGEVCYHPYFYQGVAGPAGSEYGDLHYAEAVQVTLDADGDLARCQFDALAQKYFTESFQLINGVWTRGDPQDAGPPYRNIIGIPGGVYGSLYRSIVDHNVNNMTLREGGVNGPGGDTIDEGVVYVYDSARFPFYRGEQYHQFHPNVVLGRPVPFDYLHNAKAGAIARSWINPTCGEPGTNGLTNVENSSTMCGVTAGGLPCGTNLNMSSSESSDSNGTSGSSATTDSTGTSGSSATTDSNGTSGTSGSSSTTVIVVVVVIAVIAILLGYAYRKRIIVGHSKYSVLYTQPPGSWGKDIVADEPEYGDVNFDSDNDNSVLQDDGAVTVMEWPQDSMPE